MARDRLAALRAQRGGSANPATNEPPHELSAVGPTSSRPASSTLDGYGVEGEPTLGAFHTEIAAIEEKIVEYRAHVSRIAELHGHSLGLTDDTALQADSAELVQEQQATFSLSSEIKRRIQGLLSLAKSTSGSPETVAVQRLHAERIQHKFKDAIQEYVNSETDFRTRYRQRVERQFKIVKPNATPEEIQAVVDDPAQNGAGSQIFSNAVATSDRYGQSRAAYREAQDRQMEIKRIENTLIELAQLVSDMAVLVAADDEKIAQVEESAAVADKDLEAGDEHTRQAVEHARAARRKRVYCFFLILLILAIIAIVIWLGVTHGGKT